MTNLVYVGFITGPFGLKGEVKILSDNNHLDKIFKIGTKLIIDDNEYFIKSFRKHQKNYLITFEGYEDINKIDNFLKKEVYINRGDLHLKKDDYLYSEIIGFTIVDNKEKIGIIEDILLSKSVTYIKSGKLIIPLIDKYLERVDIKNKIVYVKASKELCL